MGRGWPAPGSLQPLIPKMSVSHTQNHGPTAHPTYEGCKKAPTGSSLDNEDERNAHSKAMVVRLVQYSLTKAFCVALVIVLSAVWWLPGRQVPPPSGHISTTAVAIPATLNHARAPTSSLLEVFQMHPPVLMVARSDAPETTDDSIDSGSGIPGDDHPACSKVLAVHSFGFSYGEPFIGNYTPPKCEFNKVVWNLTVVSAGKQFDRLGIVYLGDIEVLRTSTAEPTTDGIVWTYLKVSRISEPDRLRPADFVGHDELSVPVQAGAEADLRLGEPDQRSLHSRLQRNPHSRVSYCKGK